MPDTDDRRQSSDRWQSSPLTRRSLLRRSAIFAGGAIALPGLQGLLPASAAANLAIPPDNSELRAGYGPLQRKKPVAAYTDFPAALDIEWLALPADFEYVVLGVAGDPMSDGNPTPTAHDGMGAFNVGKRRYRLIRNHENRDPGNSPLSRPIAGSHRAYDPRGAGGTTTLEIEADASGIPRLTRSFVSLNGTIVNCAGGLTSQRSWISCEETTETRLGVKHGYAFEVPFDAEGVVEPLPLAAMGRFAHEAVAMDPRTGIVYETEDAGNSGFYQYVPNRKGELFDGSLQMLAIVGEPNRDLKGDRPGVPSPEIGEALPVHWVTIPEPDSPLIFFAPKAVYNQGIALGAANFGRLEGCWYDRISRSIIFSCTDGGATGLGQVWSYEAHDHRGGALRLLFESRDGNVLAAPDNLSASPGGGILLCEDHGFDRPRDPFAPLPWARRGDDDAVEVHYLKGLTPRGEIFDFSANLLDDREWAGACFSEDARFLFANTQGNTQGFVPDSAAPENRRNFGRTYAIWGPWSRGAFGKSRSKFG